MKLTETLHGLGHPVAYFPGLAKMLGGVKAAVFLSQLLYWWERKTSDRGVYKTMEEWRDETGLSRREQEGARKILRNLEILCEDDDRLNHRKYYFINQDVLNRLWDEWHSRMHQTDIPECTKPPFGDAPNSHSSNTENTSETTSSPPEAVDTELALEVVKPETPKTKEPAPMKDPLCRQIDEAMRSIHPYENFSRERGQIKTLAARCRRRDPDHPEDVAKAMLAGFQWLRENDGFFRKQPFMPSVLSSFWERIEREMQVRYEGQKQTVDMFAELRARDERLRAERQAGRAQ